MMVQTKEGVPPAASSAAPDPATVRYPARNCVAANGAKLEDDAAAANGESVHELHLDGSCLELNQINGGASGRATIGIHYAAEGQAQLRLLVNGLDYSFLNLLPTGGWHDYKGTAALTVSLATGSTNRIRLEGGHGGANVDYVTVTPL